MAFCSHAILRDEIFEVCDSSADARFADNPLVTGAPRVIFYAGAPLATPAGQKVGTLCVIDHRPRKLDDHQRNCLRAIARQVVSLMEFRKAVRERDALAASNRQSAAWIERRKKELARFAYRCSHELRAPAIQLHNLAKLQAEDLTRGRGEDLLANAARLERISAQLLAFIDGIVEVGRAELVGSATQAIDFEQLVREASEQASTLLGNREVALESEVAVTRPVRSEYLRLRQMLAHLVSNGIRYADHERPAPFVRITVRDDGDDAVALTVEDNGLGVAPEDQPYFFDLFRRFHPEVSAGSGVGTTIVRKHAFALGAEVDLASSRAGTRVTVRLPSSPEA